MYEGATLALAFGWIDFFIVFIGVIIIGVVAYWLFSRWLDKHWF